MERRLFLTGMLGVAGAAALASLAGPSKAVAGIPNGNGILDELDKPDQAVFEDGEDQADLQPVQFFRHRHYREPYYRRRRRRRVWRRVCRRVRRHGYWIRRCWRERVWIGFRL